jgi:hypothetical protein
VTSTPVALAKKRCGEVARPRPRFPGQQHEFEESVCSNELQRSQTGSDDGRKRMGADGSRVAEMACVFPVLLEDDAPEVGQSLLLDWLHAGLAR